MTTEKEERVKREKTRESREEKRERGKMYLRDRTKISSREKGRERFFLQFEKRRKRLLVNVESKEPRCESKAEIERSSY